MLLRYTLFYVRPIISVAQDNVMPWQKLYEDLDSSQKCYAWRSSG